MESPNLNRDGALGVRLNLPLPPAGSGAASPIMNESNRPRRYPSVHGRID
ncbi:hypothetical protein WJ0W_006611 [Paenibacillus melissococcoides]|uniref:Uncharacterized protein n=1 Tax=Paenibacillus melissococcoides TaxID=2912268 RepID=A0ABN8UE44_9BACL|nr:hypothetical protein WJ0W_006611 [Paenibacillus melissococcoides]